MNSKNLAQLDMDYSTLYNFGLAGSRPTAAHCVAIQPVYYFTVYA